MKWSVAELGEICDGTVEGDARATVTGVSTDSRHVSPGDLFVAIRGETHDGHAFAAAAAAAGAAALLVSEPIDATVPQLPHVRVDDTVRAFGEIARARRERFHGPVVAITGSNGKTTTKEMCSEVLAAAGRRVHRSPQSFNNAIGVPLSIFGLKEDHDALVLELGMNHPGEIDALARIASPTVGAVTQVAPAHVGLLGSIDEIATAKGELYDRIRPHGVAVVNADDALVRAQAHRHAGRHLWFGCAADADVRADAIASDAGCPRFRLIAPDGETDVRLGVPGAHLVEDALCAAAAALATGALGADPLDAIRRGLESFAGVSGRLSLREMPGGVTLLDDAFNANPVSIEAALRTLAELAADRRRVAVIGEMRELGVHSEALHARVGAFAAQSGVGLLVAVGPETRALARAARDGGVGEIVELPDADTCAGEISARVRGGDVVLVKGSHATGMRRIVEALEAGERRA